MICCFKTINISGYLNEEKCYESYKTFLSECKALVEYRKFIAEGKVYSTNVGGRSLKIMLEVYGQQQIMGK